MHLYCISFSLKNLTIYFINNSALTVYTFLFPGKITKYSTLNNNNKETVYSRVNFAYAKIIDN